EVHGLEEACTYGAACDGEAQGVYEVASALLLFGGEATHRFLDRGLSPLGKSCEAFDELGEVLANELLTELLLELGLVVVERAAVEVADRVGDLGRQGDTLLQKVHNLLKPLHVQLFFCGRAGFDEHGSGECGEFFGTLAP